MARKFTFFVISDSDTGSGFRQITLSRKMLIFSGIILLSCLSVLTISFYSYHQLLKDKSAYCLQLERRIEERDADLANQHRRIQSFAGQLKQVKTRLFKLDKLEQKVRTVARLDQKSKEPEDALEGIGGSMPDDLDASIPLEKKHNSLLREMNAQVDQVNKYVDQYQHGLKVLLEQLKHQQKLLACKPSIKPVEGRITSNFGYRSSPFTKRREFHKGLDIANRRGTTIKATADGIVTYAGRKGSFGNIVIINHGHGIVTRYAHMHSIKTRRGISVKKGDAIGTIGNTGLSTGPHLHYEVRLNGLPVNPTKYILN